MKAARAFAFGLLFGAGLLLSGMSSPRKVLDFLDVTGPWDPSLAFVMGGAILAAAPLFALSRPRWGRGQMGPIDARLLAGAAIFGIGWGLAGICPGPALADLSLAFRPVASFLVPMAAGLLLAQRLTAAIRGARTDG